ncbi:hypothetical protein GCM10008940_27030 [Microbulbifer agarilyticus]
MFDDQLAPHIPHINFHTVDIELQCVSDGLQGIFRGALGIATVRKAKESVAGSHLDVHDGGGLPRVYQKYDHEVTASQIREAESAEIFRLFRVTGKRVYN